ncbi:MAG: SUMF1/EgtB/PvdO family nonheme iron enzyme [Planctomycetes bacterium]|nr:SUMF1/EgtB/PvdO family nonheme iron enzyme [Planctomycetota bacterium]
MSVMGPLAAFTLKAAFNTSVDQLLGWIGARFSNPSQPLQHALMRANDKAWKAVGFALAGDELFERVKPWLPGHDLTALRELIRGFLTITPTGLNQAPAGLRLQACAELARLRKAGRLALIVDRNVMIVDLWRCGDAARLLTGAPEAIAKISDALAMEAPNLTRAIRLAPPDGIPLLAAAFLYFFRREVEVNPDLARGLSFDSIRMVTAVSERGIAFLEVPTVGVLEHFDMLFDPLSDWFGRAVHELGTLRKELREWRDVNHVVAAAVDAPLTIQAFNERDRMLNFHARLRHLPGELVEWIDWQNLGDNLDACGLFKEARAAHTAAAAQARTDANPNAEADNFYRIYKDACEGNKWPEAKEALARATKLDAARFRPFDTARYHIDAVLGVSAFGTVFRCFDTEDLDDNGQPMPVVIKALRYDNLDRDPRAVFSEARTLRDLHRPGSHIIRVLGWGYANTDTDKGNRKERPYLVMEHFAGETLDAVIRRYGPMPVQVFLPVAIQIAEAIRDAHAKNVWHRDLAPSNIMSRMIETDWDVRVIDFGLAAPHEAVYHASLNIAAKRSTARDRSLTRSLEFSSPEQRGKLPGVAVGPHSDVYAFGKTCLFLLFQTTLPLPNHWASIPVDERALLQTLIERTTAETLDARFSNFDQVLDALNAFFPSAAPLAEAIEVPAVAEAADIFANMDPVEVLGPVSAIHELEPVEELEPSETLHDPEPPPDEEIHELDAVETPELSETVEEVQELEPAETPDVSHVESVPEEIAQQPEPPEVAQQPEPPAVVQPVEAPKIAQPPLEESKPASEPRPPEVVSKDPLHPGRSRTAGERFTIKLPGDLPLTFAWCPPGTFTMGSNRDDANSDEKPAHTVTLTKGFFIGIYPVTQAQWKAALMGSEPSNFPGPDRPVEQVLWEESRKFCRQMTRQLKGRAEVRLPTQAQWEYACKAGSTSDYNIGDGEESLQKAGWYEGNSGKETHPVGQLAPNAWGIHDMHGNIWEWCLDWYAEYSAEDQTDPGGPETGSDRVFRGGGWGDSAKFCRSTYRSWFDPAVRYDALGFRIVMVLPDSRT